MGFEVRPSSVTLTERETQAFELLEDGKRVDATFGVVPPGRGRFHGNAYAAPRLILLSKRATVVGTKKSGGVGNGAAAEVLLSSAHTWLAGLSAFWVLVCGLLVGSIVYLWPAQYPPKPPEAVVGPAIVTLKPGDSQQFQASSEVNWGNLPGGVYQAPTAAPEAGEVLVVHPQSGGNPVPEGTVTVIRSNDISLALKPPYAILKPGEKQRFEVLKLPAAPAENQDLRLQWSAPELGDLKDGIYTAPPEGDIQVPKTILLSVRTTTPDRIAAARVVLLPEHSTLTPLISIVLLFGALGASLHGVNSLAAYVGSRQFKSSWVLYYLARPFVGATLALLMFLVFRSNLVSNLSSPNTSDFYAVAALAGLVGLFTDKAAKKLEDIVDALLSPRPDERSDKLGTLAVPKIASVDPKVLGVGGNATEVSLTGSNFAAGLKALVNGGARGCEVVSPTSAKVALETGDLATAGTLKIKVVSASGAESNEVSVTVK